MKKIFKSGGIQKILNSALLMLIFCSVSAQNSGFVKGDENYTLTLAFHKVDTMLVVVPHNYKISDQEKRTIENYVFWDQYQKKPIYVYKKETELASGDDSKHLQFYGPFCDFKIAEIQNIPIKQIPGGFWFNDEAFTQAGDAFFYIKMRRTDFTPVKIRGKSFRKIPTMPQGISNYTSLRETIFI